MFDFCTVIWPLIKSNLDEIAGFSPDPANNLLSQYLLSTYCVPSFLLGRKGTVVTLTFVLEGGTLYKYYVTTSILHTSCVTLCHATSQGFISSHLQHQMRTVFWVGGCHKDCINTCSAWWCLQPEWRTQTVHVNCSCSPLWLLCKSCLGSRSDCSLAPPSGSTWLCDLSFPTC